MRRMADRTAARRRYLLPVWFLLLVALADAAIFNLCYVAAFYLRFLGPPPGYNFVAYLLVAPWITMGLWFLFQTYGLYSPQHRARQEVLPAVLSALLLDGLLAVALSFALGGFSFPRSVFLIVGLLQLPALGAWHRLVWQWSQRMLGQRRIVVVGSAAEGADLAAKLSEHSAALVPVATADAPPAPDAPEDAWTDWLAAHPGDAYLLAPSLPGETKVALATRCSLREVPVLLVPDLYDILLFGAHLNQVDDLPVLEVGTGLPDGARFLKRSIDLVFAAVGLVVTAPLLALVALGVKLSSPGPVLYRQERVGEKGRRFVLYKFRTMRADAERLSGPTLAVSGDPRITPLGRVLRLSHLDELPQLYNILVGEMSLVGPRPERPFFVEQFARSVPNYAERLKLRAGLTGLAQVSGKYTTDPKDKLRYDLLYARAYSPLQDLRILLHTVRSLFQRGRAL